MSLLTVLSLAPGRATADVQRQLERAALVYGGPRAQDQREREQRIEAEIRDCFEPSASVRVAGSELDPPGVRGLLGAAVALSRRFIHATLTLDRFEVRVDDASARASFQATFTGEDDTGRQTVDRRPVRAQLIQRADGRWRIHQLEVAGPDQADPEARP